MGRRKKVTTVYHGRLGQKADVYIDEDGDGMFYARVGDQHFKEERLQDLKDAVLAAMRDVSELVFKPVIVVDVDEDKGDSTVRHSHGAGNFVENRARLSFGFYRIELAVRGEEKFFRPFLEEGLDDDDREDWDLVSQHKRQQREDNERWRKEGQDISKFNEEGAIIPYTPATWAALMQLRAKISDMSLQLKTLLSQENAERMLAQAVARLALPAGEEKKDAAPRKTKRPRQSRRVHR
jgi:hypothetical protein